MNCSVNYLIANRFTSIRMYKKLNQTTRPSSDLKGLITKADKGKNEYIRHINLDYYVKHE